MGFLDYMFGWWNPRVPVEVDRTAASGKAPKPDAALAKTNTFDAYLLQPDGAIGIGVSSSGGNYTSGQSSAYNNCFWDWRGAWLDTPQTYEWMLCHPKIAHAYSQVVNSILASAWDVDVADGTPEAQAQLVRDMFFPLRRPYVESSMLGMAFGCAGGQSVFTIREGRNWISRVRPLPIHKGLGNILTDRDTDELLGIRWPYNRDNKTRDFLGPEAWVYTHDRYRAPNQYGRSRLNNLRQLAWRPWLETWQKLARMFDKLSGKYLIVKVPKGKGKDANGVPYDFQVDGANVIQALANDAPGAVLTNMVGVAPNDPDLTAKLAKASLVSLEALDFGSISPAVMGCLATLEHCEGLMSEGMLRTPRTSGSAQQKHSGRADTEQHTQTDLLDSQLLADDIDTQINEQQVEPVMLLNFGAAYKPGSVKLKTKPLQDDTKDRASATVDVALQTSWGEKVADLIGMDQVATNAGYKPDRKWDDVKAEWDQKQADQLRAQADAKAQQQQQPGSNGQGKNGNGRQKVGGRIGQR